MTVKTGSVWAGTFVTLDATGALAAGTPSGVLYVNGVANAAEVTISGTNPYKWSVTLPTLTAGQRVDIYITATINEIATAAVVASEQADTGLVSDVQSSMALEATLTATAEEVWEYAARTLTQSAASVASAVAGSTITATRGDTLSAALTNIGALTNYDKIWFTVKSDEADTDAQSLIQIELSDGLKYINGAAAVTAGNGSLTIVDEATGGVTIALHEVEMAKLALGSYHYDIQILRTTGIAVSTLSSGTFIVSADYTKATS
jgi:hypothetical protein